MRAAKSMPEDDAVRHLMGFLFDYEQVRRPVGAMSGGERTRLRCLQLMLAGANCLILDEPTNHLDIDAVEVLEGALETSRAPSSPCLTTATSWTGSPTGSSRSPTSRCTPTRAGTATGRAATSRTATPSGARQATAIEPATAAPHSTALAK